MDSLGLLESLEKMKKSVGRISDGQWFSGFSRASADASGTGRKDLGYCVRKMCFLAAKDHANAIMECSEPIVGLVAYGAAREIARLDKTT